MQLRMTVTAAIVGIATSFLSAVPAAAATLPRAQLDLTGQQWGLVAVGAPSAWSAGQGEGVIVAVVDSGVDGTHPEFQGRLVDGVTFSGRTPAAVPAGTSTDPLGHGTHVAGIIGAAADGKGVTGVAPRALIMPVQLSNSRTEFNERAIADAVRWAADHGAQVMNLSLGTAALDAPKLAEDICAATSYAISRGVLVVASAGNEGDSGNPLNVPASCPGVLSVTAISAEGRASSFTSFDASTGITAPGQDILSSTPAAVDPAGYVEHSGTSMAAPHVSGAAALVLGSRPEASATEVVEMLRSTARDLGPEGPDPVYGAGALDAAAAVGLAQTAWTGQPRVRASAEVVGGTVHVTWAPPGDQTVTRYEVSQIDGGALATVDGRTVRASVPVGSLSGAEPLLQVTAVLAGGGQLASTPVFVAVKKAQSSGVQQGHLVLKAEWTRPGVLVTWPKRHAPEFFTVRLLRGNSHQVSGAEGKLLIEVPYGDTLRSSELAVLAVQDNEVLGTALVQPQYGVSVEAMPAGSGHTYVVGVLFKCTRHCEGRQVRLTDRSGQLLGISWTNEYGEFAVTVGKTRTLRAAVGAEVSSWTPVQSS